MGSGGSRQRRDGSDFDVEPEKLINGGSSLSTMDTSHSRKMTDEERNSRQRECDYEGGTLSLMVGYTRDVIYLSKSMYL